MQTFLPLPSFAESAAVLDSRRLGKQRVETLQLLNTLTGLRKGWVNHPAARMWRGYEPALIEYGLTMCREWLHRGYSDTCYGKISMFPQAHEPVVMPPWLGDPAFHASHRSALLRKDPVHYGQFGWAEPDDLPYVWPEASSPPPHAPFDDTR